MKAAEINLPSGVRVGVRPVSFAAWRDIRSNLIGLLSERIIGVVTAVADGPLMAAVRRELSSVEVARAGGVEVPIDTLGLLRSALDELGRGTLEKIGTVLRDVAETLADLSDDFTRGCATEAISDELPAIDFMMLRDKAFEVSDPGALLEREKNFVRGVSDVLVKLIGTNSTPHGGSEQNI